MKTVFDFMNIAIEESKKSKDIPIAALLVSQKKRNNSFLYIEYEYIVKTNNKFHAEIELFLEDKNYENIDIFITHEPCPMCLYFLMEKNIQRLFFCEYNPYYGSCGGKIYLSSLLNKIPKIRFYGGLFSTDVLSKYFQKKRK